MRKAKIYIPNKSPMQSGLGKTDKWILEYETNDPVNFKEKIDDKYLNMDSIREKIDNQRDIIGRNDNFKKITLDSSFPKYLITNLKLYSDWIA